MRSASRLAGQVCATVPGRNGRLEILTGLLIVFKAGGG